MGLPVPVAPSPKFQLNVYGEVPPETVALNVTAWPTLGEDGLKVKLAAKEGFDWWTRQPVSGWISQPLKLCHA